MFAAKFLKNPVLIIGILIAYVGFYQMRENGMFDQRADKLRPISCRSVLVMLKKNIAEGWQATCEENNLTVTLSTELKRSNFKDAAQYKAGLYRELANSLNFIARNSLNESLERTEHVTVELTSPHLQIRAHTMGKDVAPLATMKDRQFVAEHIQRTVKVQEKKL